jgi:hypothetical protein
MTPESCMLILTMLLSSISIACCPSDDYPCRISDQLTVNTTCGTVKLQHAQDSRLGGLAAISALRNGTGTASVELILQQGSFSLVEIEGCFENLGSTATNSLRVSEGNVDPQGFVGPCVVTGARCGATLAYSIRCPDGDSHDGWLTPAYAACL